MHEIYKFTKKHEFDRTFNTLEVYKDTKVIILKIIPFLQIEGFHKMESRCLAKYLREVSLPF